MRFAARRLKFQLNLVRMQSRSRPSAAGLRGIAAWPIDWKGNPLATRVSDGILRPATAPGIASVPIQRNHASAREVSLSHAATLISMRTNGGCWPDPESTVSSQCWVSGFNRPATQRPGCAVLARDVSNTAVRTIKRRPGPLGFTSPSITRAIDASMTVPRFGALAPT